ncbi:MAG: SDR family NAD(P)-dependent oxidoreductase [Pseudomonadales bacterium]|nr:SDR family NAD(P)-dependent oxidoreductase [Pseudomonadales bacterium]|tara:strand:- start:1696 stop:2571 length:876 start_codon:yes stop_codon:yes gene_type:complete
MKHFEGKTAVVTGAASGIGFGLAQRFAEENMQVVMADLEQTALEEAVEKLEKQQHRVVGIPADVLIQESVNELYSKSRETFGNIHVLCNNAGIAASSGNKPIWEVERTDWQWTLGVNFYGVLYGIQAFLPHMIEHGEDGHVVTTASLAGLIRGAGPYGVSKHAVRALAETLNSDLVARGAKIRSSVLCPGFVNTNIGKSERNRPSNLTQLQAPLEDIENSPIMALLRNGKEPSEIADIVIEAIRDDLFYILPHPAWDDTLKTYFEEILSREALNSPSLPAFLTPRDDGEKY